MTVTFKKKMDIITFGALRQFDHDTGVNDYINFV